MRIKHRLSILAATVTAAITVTAIAAAAPDTEKPAGDLSDPLVTVSPVPEPPDVQSATTPERCYWVHEQDGMVAVFDADNRNEPITVTGIALHTLREGDQAMILGGVLIEGETNLYHFLEGFGP